MSPRPVAQVLGDITFTAVGPFALFRNSRDRLDRGFTVRDGNNLSARWPGDAHRFAADYADMLE
jgi:protease I